MAFSDGMSACYFDDMQQDVSAYLKDAGYIGYARLKEYELENLIAEVILEQSEMYANARYVMQEITDDLTELTNDLIKIGHKEYYGRRKILADRLEDHQTFMLKYKWLDCLILNLRRALPIED